MLLAGESLAGRGLLLAFHLGHGAVEDQHPAGHALPHAHVQVRLRALDVVVQVVAEARQQRDGLLLAVAADVALLQRKGYVPGRLRLDRQGQARELSGRLLAKVNRRRSAYSTLGLDEFLQENSGQGAICEVGEIDLEDHDHLRRRGTHVHRLRLSILHLHDGQAVALLGEQGIEGTVQWTARDVPPKLADCVQELSGIAHDIVTVKLKCIVETIGGGYFHSREVSLKQLL